MSRLLAHQSINVAPLVAGQRNVRQHKESEKSPRSVKTMYRTLRVPGLRMSGFSSGLLRTVNPLDTNTMLRPVQVFGPNVPTSFGGARRRRRFVPKAMYERFTEQAITAILLSQEEARRLCHNFVGTEQILLGVICEGTGIAVKVLKSVGIKLKDARLEVEEIIGKGDGFVAVQIPFTPRAKRVLELSLEEARRLEFHQDTTIYIGSEHLLLGLLREGEGVAARVLQKMGVDPVNIRAKVYEELLQK